MKSKIIIIVVFPLLLYLFSPLLEIALGGVKRTLFDIQMLLSSRESIEQKMDNATEVNQMNRLINAFVKTGINDDYIVNKLEDMLYNTIPNSHFHPVEQEVLSVGLVMDLGASNRDDRFLKLVKIASNNSFSYTTRSVALDELYYDLPKNTTIDKDNLKARLQQISQDILSSPNDFKNKKYQEMLNEDVLNVVKILEKK